MVLMFVAWSSATGRTLADAVWTASAVVGFVLVAARVEPAGTRDLVGRLVGPREG
ncbi:hypothetical protein [Actinosynnema sp. NPDC020468]|uniref:hypothetical protein n=1 Tax=Actinosynnema sp. NPDC020468 TaxID=3154488 RepID=UPI003408C9B5